MKIRYCHNWFADCCFIVIIILFGKLGGGNGKQKMEEVGDSNLMYVCDGMGWDGMGWDRLVLFSSLSPLSLYSIYLSIYLSIYPISSLLSFLHFSSSFSSLLFLSSFSFSFPFSVSLYSYTTRYTVRCQHIISIIPVGFRSGGILEALSAF